MPIVNCTITRSAQYQIYIEYSVEQNIGQRQSTLSHSLKIKQLTNKYDFAGNMSVTYHVNGVAFEYNGYFDFNDKGDAGYVATITSGSTVVTHDATTGDATVTFSCDGSCESGGYGPGNILLSAVSVKLDRLPLYDLSIEADDNSAVSVIRTSSGGNGSVNVITDGKEKLYYGDNLKITFASAENYILSRCVVNGFEFTSGNTHTVTGDVVISSSSLPRHATISATDANIGSTSVIVIDNNSSIHTHTIEYNMGSLSGVIAEKTTSTMVSWRIPDEFYQEMPNQTTMACVITCTSYAGESEVGMSSCTINVSAHVSDCYPAVSGTVVDINETAILFTGDNTKLIRYVSVAQCTIDAQAKNYASIARKYINNVELVDTDVVIFDKVESGRFDFLATDSRGLSSSSQSSNEVIKYIPLTFNPTITRPSPTRDVIAIRFSGNYYNGSFGAHNNTLTIQYRYRAKSDNTFSDWATIPSSNYTIGDSSYSTNGYIELSDSFDYNKQFVFEVRAIDGSIDNPLTTVSKFVDVAKGVPTFDWGEDDFNFNVPVMIHNVNIFDIFYPVGTVYTSTSNFLPTILYTNGAWRSINTGVSGLFSWERTE